ncbi:MAG: hypothetical protein EBY17_02270 [Acidobacteriia bacterium]|nr:hypothetical protein [Terriglobia bacterium]
MNKWTFRISGLIVGSELKLPGVDPVPGPQKQPDVLIRLRPVPELLDSPVKQGPGWQLSARHFLLRLAGIGGMLCTDGQTVDLDPAPGTDPNDALPFVLGTCFGVVLLQRGGLVLHGSAVADAQGRAFVFCGRSGIGKSTLAAALCRSGTHFVTDDVCSVSLAEAGSPVIWPDGRQLKLLENSITHLDLAAQRRGAVRSGIGKCYIEPPAPPALLPHGAGTPLQLAAVYILNNDKLSGATVIERLSPLESAQALHGQSYRRRVSLAMVRRSSQVALTAAVVSHVPVFTLTRPPGLDQLARTVSDLHAHWQELPQ